MMYLSQSLHSLFLSIFGDFPRFDIKFDDQSSRNAALLFFGYIGIYFDFFNIVENGFRWGSCSFPLYDSI